MQKNIRQLAAIMFTDMVGYTAQMQQDEHKAKKNRDRHRQVLEKSTADFHGLILQYYGDGTLSVFGSVIEAVECAVEIQTELQKEPKIPLRIGLHVGDIVYADDGVYGDAVNVASRIENLSVPGGVLISEKVFDEIKNHQELKTVSLGEYELKNVKRPIKLFALTNEGLKVPTKKSSSKEVHNSIAVLPLVNMSSDPEQEYFSDGMAEEIINSLTQIKGLKVVGRTSSFAFKGKNLDIKTIGKKLNVSTILEGSIQKSGDRVRITAQLINTNDGFHLWSDRYDRKLENIFAVQDEISSKIAEKMKITFAENQDEVSERKSTSNMEAYELLLKGRYYREQGVEGFEKALDCLQKAIALDPEYAQAYGELATTYFSLSIYKFIPQREGYNKVLELSNKAILLDPNLPGGHLGLARYNFLVTWDWEAALTEYEKELELGSPPDMFFPLYQTYLHGNFEKAIYEAKLIIEQDPLNIELLQGLVDIYLIARRHDELREVLNKISELNPLYSEAYRFYGRSYFYEGKYEKALSYFKKAADVQQGKGFSTTDIITTLVKLGQREEAERLFSILREGVSSKMVFAFEIAIIYYYLGESDKAFQKLDRAYENREFWLVSLKVSPYWDPLRSDPRFQKLLDRMNFPD